MSKLQEREKKRRSIIGGMIDGGEVTPAEDPGRGRPKENRELKKRISLSVLPSLYDDMKAIAYMQRKSVSELLSEMMETCRSENAEKLDEYKKLKNAEK